MAKYIFKESELKSILEDIIKEEIENLDEGLLRNITHTAGSIAKTAALGAIAPHKLAGNIYSSYMDMIMGKKRPLDPLRDFFISQKPDKVSYTKRGNKEKKDLPDKKKDSVEKDDNKKEDRD